MFPPSTADEAYDGHVVDTDSTSVVEQAEVPAT